MSTSTARPWVLLGGGGLVAAAPRDEQRKMIKYNHLVANLLVFHTIVGMTKALDAIAADGRHQDAVNDAALAGLSPTKPSTSTASATTSSTSANRRRRSPLRRTRTRPSAQATAPV